MCLSEKYYYVNDEGQRVDVKRLIACEERQAGRECQDVRERDLGEQASRSSTAAQNSPTFSTFSSDRSAVGTAISSHSAASSPITPGLSRRYSLNQSSRRHSSSRQQTPEHNVEIVKHSSLSSNGHRRRGSRGHSQDSTGRPVRADRRVPAPNPPPAVDFLRQAANRRRQSVDNEFSGESSAQRPATSHATLGSGSLQEHRSPAKQSRSSRPRSALVSGDLSAGRHITGAEEAATMTPAAFQRKYSSEPTSSRRANNTAPAARNADAAPLPPIVHQRLGSNSSSGSTRSRLAQPSSRSPSISPASLGTSLHPPPPDQQRSPSRRRSSTQDPMSRAILREEQRQRNAQEWRLKEFEQIVNETTIELAEVNVRIEQLSLLEQKQRAEIEKGAGSGASSSRPLWRSRKSTRNDDAQRQRRAELADTGRRIEEFQRQTRSLWTRKRNAQANVDSLRKDIDAQDSSTSPRVELVIEEEDETVTLPRIASSGRSDEQVTSVYASEVRSPTSPVRGDTEVRVPQQSFDTRVVRGGPSSRRRGSTGPSSAT